MNDNRLRIRFVESEDGRLYDFDYPMPAQLEAQERIATSTQSKESQNDMKQMNIETWDAEYVDSLILDGMQWSVKIHFEEGDVMKIYGSNAYPSRWNEFIAFLNHSIDKELF